MNDKLDFDILNKDLKDETIRKKEKAEQAERPKAKVIKRGTQRHHT